MVLVGPARYAAASAIGFTAGCTLGCCGWGGAQIIIPTLTHPIMGLAQISATGMHACTVQARVCATPRRAAPRRAASRMHSGTHASRNARTCACACVSVSASTHACPIIFLHVGSRDVAVIALPRRCRRCLSGTSKYDMCMSLCTAIVHTTRMNICVRTSVEHVYKHVYKLLRCLLSPLSSACRMECSMECSIKCSAWVMTRPKAVRAIGPRRPGHRGCCCRPLHARRTWRRPPRLPPQQRRAKKK